MDEPSLALTRIRALDLIEAPVASRPLHLSAASGLVFTERHFYVVADDELHLAVFITGSEKPGWLIRLFAGELPYKPKWRKAAKPDSEILLHLPPSARYQHGALLTLGSGSKPQRRGAVLLVLDARGLPLGEARSVDLLPMYAALEAAIEGVNLEGAAICGDSFFLLQRGNKGEGRNALIRMPLAALLAAIDGERWRGGDFEILALRQVDLGRVNGIPLCFTDGAVLPDGRIVFSAVAENTKDSYQDGPCAGAAIGVIDAQGTLLCLRRLAQPYKVEGIDARLDGDAVLLRLVTDADDVAVSAGLYSAVLELPPRA